LTTLKPAVARPLALAALLLLGGCSLFRNSTPKEDPSTIPVEVMYNRGADAMEARRYDVAVTQFDNVEQYYPFSPWAANAQIMESYAQYLQGKYVDSIGTLDRFIQLHPSSRDISYAYYLRALDNYEQIEDIQRDQKGTQDALVALQEVVNRFPDSSYARDAKLKIDLARDHLAGKELEIGRFYERQHLYAAAIGRFQRVVDDYQTTNHVAEALHRLVEVYLLIGLPDQAVRVAAVLGHNYPGSEWYLDSYDQLVADGQVRGQHVQLPSPDRPGLLSRWLGWIF
jgi:outer membrane protein assembly factor BamD